MRASMNVLSVFVLVAVAGVAPVLAQDFPNKRITLVIGVTPGGPQDTVARLVSDRMKDSLGVPIVVENRPGVGGVLAFEAVRVAQPDGYTLTVSHSGIASAKFLVKSFTADPVKDFTHIGQMTMVPLALVVNAAAPYKTLAEFLAYARANPGKINMGNLSGQYALDIALLQSMANIDVTAVMYAGTAQLEPALASNEVTVAMDIYSGAKPFAEQGRTRFIGVGSLKRFGLLPDIPAIAEAVPGYEATTTWHGLSGPAGIPPAVAARLGNAMRAALQSPDLRKRLNDAGFEVIGGSAEELRGLIGRDLERAGNAAKLAGVKPQ